MISPICSTITAWSAPYGIEVMTSVGFCLRALLLLELPLAAQLEQPWPVS